jgi:hypothetical protein
MVMGNGNRTAPQSKQSLILVRVQEIEVAALRGDLGWMNARLRGLN